MTPKPTLVCSHLEPYKARYTERLSEWEKAAFSQLFNVESNTPDGDQLVMDILSGEVLDTVQRPLWALKQSLRLLSSIAVTKPVNTKYWFSDFYHPGLDALAYTRKSFKAYSFLWAQTFDLHDFTAKHLIDWMPQWETMALGIYQKVFVASDLLREFIMVRFPHDNIANKVVKVGLPFSYEDCLNAYPDFSLTSLDRPYDVVWSSRMDTEKNFKMFVDIARAMPDLKFVVCSGHPVLRGTDLEAMRLRDDPAHCPRNLEIRLGCTKAQYYRTLSQSKVQFNCARQDWVSFTLLEALTFGCIPVYPMTRSFTEELPPLFLYKVGAITDAITLIRECTGPQMHKNIVSDAYYTDMRESILVYHNHTLNRIAMEINND